MSRGASTTQPTLDIEILLVKQRGRLPSGEANIYRGNNTKLKNKRRNLDAAETIRNTNSFFRLFSYSYFSKFNSFACCERYLYPKTSKTQLTKLSTVNMIEQLCYLCLLRQQNNFHIHTIPKMLEKCQQVGNEQSVSNVFVSSQHRKPELLSSCQNSTKINDNTHYSFNPNLIKNPTCGMV